MHLTQPIPTDQPPLSGILTRCLNVVQDGGVLDDYERAFELRKVLERDQISTRFAAGDEQRSHASEEKSNHRNGDRTNFPFQADRPLNRLLALNIASVLPAWLLNTCCFSRCSASMVAKHLLFQEVFCKHGWLDAGAHHIPTPV